MKVEQFCHSILRMEIQKNKAVANLVMGLASQTYAKSVVEISMSPCYHYQYSSISDAIDGMFSCKEEPAEVEKAWKESEKKFVYQKGSLCQALWKILVAEYGQQFFDTSIWIQGQGESFETGIQLKV